MGADSHTENVVLIRWLLRLVWTALLGAAVLGGAAAWWLHQPVVVGGKPLDLSVEPGTTPRGVAKLAAESGIQADPQLLYWWFRLSGQAG